MNNMTDFNVNIQEYHRRNQFMNQEGWKQKASLKRNRLLSRFRKMH
jgi:hypothetical protein